MALDQRKYEHKHEAILRDVRPLWVRIASSAAKPSNSAAVFIIAAACIYFWGWALAFADLIMVLLGLYFWWLTRVDRTLAFKMPMGAKYKDKNNMGPGKSGQAEGILYLGNVEKTKEEVWFTNSDARTHVLYLGTTGSGKTEGLKSMVTNAMAWGSGFVYVDGKADTDLWSSLSALVRRFGRDDDLLVLNYMTGNSDIKAPSNTMNPFSSGSASYLVQLLVSLMPESEGDNAMWKERAVSLIGAMMPVLTWKRDNQDIPLTVTMIRDYLSLGNVIKLSRDEVVPAKMRAGLVGYLDTLPGYVDSAFGDDGKQKPPGPDSPPVDTTTCNQQHGYLAMQFTRSLQSLGDDYGYIFDAQAADVDMVDIVLNRRILVVLIPALEKSSDEIANLGKIVAATIKGMMGSALGSTVEGTSETVIENKPTHSSTPFMTVFDEVGYYTAQGMAVMAAQARSLGFCLVFSGQDLPAMKKRVREEANSITANCNIKIFGKLEDPTETKEFFEKTVGSAIVTEVSGYQLSGGADFGSYSDTKQAGVQLRPRASYDELRGFKEGQAVITFGEAVIDCKMFYSNPGHAKAMRVTRFMSLPPPDEDLLKHASAITKLRDHMVHKSWTAMRADVAVETPPEFDAIKEAFEKFHVGDKIDKVDVGISAVVQVYGLNNDITTPVEGGTDTKAPVAPVNAPATSVPAQEIPPLVNTQPPEKSEPPKTPPLTQQKPVEQTQQKAPPSSGGSPLGFFKKDQSATPQESAQESPPPVTPQTLPQSAQPAEKEQPPVQTASEKPASGSSSFSWEDFIDKDKTKTPSVESSSSAPSSAMPQSNPYTLPPEIEDIVKKAGKAAGKNLFTGTDKEGTDAAE